jgi:hypothetical protein
MKTCYRTCSTLEKLRELCRAAGINAECTYNPFTHRWSIYHPEVGLVWAGKKKALTIIEKVSNLNEDLKEVLRKTK